VATTSAALKSEKEKNIVFFRLFCKVCNYIRAFTLNGSTEALRGKTLKKIRTGF
jgi:hypothetical protein